MVFTPRRWAGAQGFTPLSLKGSSCASHTDFIFFDRSQKLCVVSISQPWIKVRHKGSRFLFHPEGSFLQGILGLIPLQYVNEDQECVVHQKMLLLRKPNNFFFKKMSLFPLLGHFPILTLKRMLFVPGVVILEQYTSRQYVTCALVLNSLKFLLTWFLPEQGYKAVMLPDSLTSFCTWNWNSGKTGTPGNALDETKEG